MFDRFRDFDLFCHMMWHRVELPGEVRARAHGRRMVQAALGAPRRGERLSVHCRPELPVHSL